MRCPLCGLNLTPDEAVGFGIFQAHAGCSDDYYRDFASDDERVDAVERDA